MGQKFYKNTKKSSLYCQNLLIFIRKTAVVENNPTTREIKRITTAQVNTDGNHSLFLHGQLAHLHAEDPLKKVSNIASDEVNMENNYMFVLLWNLSVISHLIFPQCFFYFCRQI